jgi:DNA (cytosine-5)-methyltransferase 1
MSHAYYNEIDPFAATWLENLVAAGALPPGDVDRRSIADVRAGDLIGYTECHFFAGVGVWPCALGGAGWPEHRQVWTGSCPCQPFSRSGGRRGFADERHLWPVWLNLIRECRPATIFGEQVTGPDGRAWLDSVSLDLENAGFAFGAADLSAAGVGAPHDRARHFFVGARMGNTTGLDEERNGPVAGAGKEQEQPNRGAGAPRRAGAVDGYWKNADLVGGRDGWRRPVEPRSRPVAARSPTHLAVMRSLGNAIVAPVAIEFIGAFLDTEAEAVAYGDDNFPDLN